MRCLIKNAAMVKQNGEKVTVNILTEGNRIERISCEAIDVPALEYDLTGYTVMPGFINTHVHLMDCFDGFNTDKLKKWLMSGVTYLRDEGILSRCQASDAVSFRESLKKSCMYPSISVCGKFISAVNGQGGAEPLCVSTETEARQAVDTQVEAGVDHIKITLDEGYDSYTQSLALLPKNILTAVCDQAHKHGKKVSAHVNRSDKLSILLEAGIDEAGHTCFDPIPDRLLEFMVKNNVAMTPTLCIYGEITTNFGAPLLYGAMENTKRFVDMGGVIGLGNDYIEEKQIWSPVGMPMMEIELLQKAGLSMQQIIKAATENGARILGREEYGKLEENCIADIIAVKGDPYELPYLFTNVQFVMKDGIVVKKE